MMADFKRLCYKFSSLELSDFKLESQKLNIEA